MDDLIEAVIELFGDLLEQALKGIKDPNKRKWALTIFYSVFWLGITAFLAYWAVMFAKENNTPSTIAMGILAGAVFLVFGFFLIRAHRRNWREH